MQLLNPLLLAGIAFELLAAPLPVIVWGADELRRWLLRRSAGEGGVR